MIEAAITAEEVADELQHMTAEEIRDPLKLVLRNARLARRLREIATMIRETASPKPRATNPGTTCPKERRRVIARKGRQIAVESRSGGDIHGAVGGRDALTQR